MLTVEQEVLSMAECVAAPLCFKLHMLRRHVRERGLLYHTTNFKTVNRFLAFSALFYLFIYLFLPHICFTGFKPTFSSSNTPRRHLDEYFGGSASSKDYF